MHRSIRAGIRLWYRRTLAWCAIREFYRLFFSACASFICFRRTTPSLVLSGPSLNSSSARSCSEVDTVDYPLRSIVPSCCPSNSATRPTRTTRSRQRSRRRAGTRKSPRTRTTHTTGPTAARMDRHLRNFSAARGAQRALPAHNAANRPSPSRNLALMSIEF